MDKDLLRKLDFLYDLLMVFRKYGYQIAKGAVVLYPDDIPEIDLGEHYASFTEEGRFYIVDATNTRWVYKDKQEYLDRLRDMGW